MSGDRPVHGPGRLSVHQIAATWLRWCHAPACRLLLAIGAAQIASSNAAYAHAYGERYDLPVPLWLNLVGGAAVVVLSFAISAWVMRPATGPRDTARTNLLSVRWLGPLHCPATLLVVQLASVFLFGLALATGLFGASDFSRNAAPTIMWVLGWVGLAFVSALIGNVWLIVNPWLILFDWARRLTGQRLSLDLPYPERLGVLPGIVLVTGFVWFMLASGVAGEPWAIARALALYSFIMWIGMVLFGPAAWLARADAFTLIGTVLARFSPTELRVSDPAVCKEAGCPPDAGGCADCPGAFLRAPAAARALFLRPYGAGLVVAQPLSLSMIVLVLMVLAMVAFEGFMDTAQWLDLLIALGERPDDIYAPGKTVALFLVATALLYLIFLVVSALMRRIGQSGANAAGAPDRRTHEIMGLFVLSLVPIAFAYHVAHYLYWFFANVQYVIPAASDPFGWGWDLFGGRNFVPDRAAISLKVIWHTAIVAIVVGHVISVYVAHRQALIVFATRRAALWSQVPMLVLMVAYTMSSLWMLAQPIMG